MKRIKVRPIIEEKTEYTRSTSQHYQFARGVMIGVQAQLESCEKDMREFIEEIEQLRSWQVQIYEWGTWQTLKDKYYVASRAPDSSGIGNWDNSIHKEIRRNE